MSTLPDHLRRASLGIVERLAPAAGARGVASGVFIDSLLRKVSSLIGSLGRCQAVPSPPELEPEYRQGIAGAGLVNVEVRRADILQYLEATPAASLDFVFSCWELGTIRPKLLIGAARKALRAEGIFGLVSVKSESPFMALSLLAAAAREVTGKKVSAMSLPFPKTPDELRKLLRKEGLDDLRAWEDKGEVDLPDGAAAYEHLCEVSGGSLLGNVDAETSRRIRDSFAKKLQDVCGPGRVWITHDFLGAVGVVPRK
jgi:hypothetical protein